MQGNFTLTAGEYAEGQLAWRRHLARARTRYGIPVLRIAGVLLLLGGAYLVISGGDVFWIVYDLLIGAFLVLYYGPGQTWKFKREFRRARTLHSEKTVDLSDEGVRTTSSLGQGIVKWGAFSRWAETRNLYLLSVPPRIFYILPKRAFSTSDQDAIRRLLEQKIGSGKP